MKKTTLMLLALFSLIAVAKAEVQWKRVITADEGFLAATRSKQALSELIPVDINIEYVVSGEFKHDNPITFLYFCMIPYDKNRKKIQPFHVANIPGTDMSLAGACKAGDSAISIKDGAKWKAAFDKNRRKPYVAFNADHEGTFSDLPNSNTVQMTKIEKAGDAWTVTLKSPCIKDYPGGTKLRLHYGSGGIMMLALVPEKDFPIGPLKKISVTISGERLSGVGKNNKDEAFWKGTKYVQFFIMALKNKVLFKNISIKESE